MKVLLVEDVDSLRSVLQLVLEKEGYAVHAVPSAEDAIEKFNAGQYDCVISDFKLTGLDGLQLLTRVRALDNKVPFLIMTAFGTIDLAVDAMKFGASDFLAKPFEPEVFLKMIRKLVAQRQFVDKELGLATRRSKRILTKSPEMLAIVEQARRVARVDSPVMVFGESGTGKELLARYIHEQSSRKDKPFVAVNCAALPYHLLESEFFGHEAGAFTGAAKTREGLFEYAAEGTIFLDEIGDMPKQLQVKLLRALQEKEIKRVGGNRSIAINPRIIAATNCSEKMVLETERLREDLYYRLAVITFELLPLRERLEDISFLADYFIDFFCSTFSKSRLQLSKDTAALLQHYSWPGNIRELENIIERAVLLAEDVISPEHCGLEFSLEKPAVDSASLHDIAECAARAAEIDAIVRMLRHTVGNKSQAARELGVSYKTLLHKVKAYNL